MATFAPTSNTDHAVTGGGVSVDLVTGVITGGTGDGLITLRSALLAANATAGVDTIELAQLNYQNALTGAGEDAGLSGDLDITDNVIIIGVGAGFSLVRGGGIDRVFDIAPGVTATLSNLDVRNGVADHGGGIRVQAGGHLTFDGQFLGNEAEDSSLARGGGLFLDAGATFEVLAGRTVAFVQNAANTEGIGSALGGAIYVTDGVFGDFAGDLSLQGNLAIANFDQSFAAGGGIYLAGGVLNSADNLTFNLNRANTSEPAGGDDPGEARGGGLYLASAGPHSITGAVFTSNSVLVGAGTTVAGAGYGGAIYSVGELRLEDVTFTSNNVSNSSGTLGADAYGGAIASEGLLTIVGGLFDGNFAEAGDGSIFARGPAAYGGAIFATGDVTIDGTVFTGNIAQGGAHTGAGTFAAGSGHGGAIAMDSTVAQATIAGATFTGNQALGGFGQANSGFGFGGALWLSDTVLILSGSTFESNLARGGDSGAGLAFGAEGGAIYIDNSSDAPVEIRDSDFEGNIARGGDSLAANALGQSIGGRARGGAFSINSDARVDFTNVNAVANVARGGDAAAGTASGFSQGGGASGGVLAALNASHLRWVGGLISQNGVDSGDADATSLNIQMDGVQGGFASTFTQLTEFIGLTIRGNSANGGLLLASSATIPGTSFMIGGAIHSVDAELIIDSTTIEDNRVNAARTGADSGSAYGGGVFAAGVATIRNSTLSGNRAENLGSGNDVTVGAFGGGIYASELTLENSTLSVNVARSVADQSSGNGGGIFLTGNTATIRNSTIVNNLAQASNGDANGAGIFIDSFVTAPTISSSLIAGNLIGAPGSTIGPNIRGTATSLGFNLIGTVAGATITPLGTDTFGASDDLNVLGVAALADNGGPVQTHALLSTATLLIDQGTDNGLATDARGPGFARLNGAAADIGAFETGFNITSAVTNEDVQTTTGLVVADPANFTHFKVTNVTNGSVFLSDGVTAVTDGSFITAAQAAAGLRFTPASDFLGAASFDLEASLSADDSGLTGDVDTAVITVNPVADTPSVTNATTDEDVQTTSGLVISRNAVDGSEVTHFKITNVVNGTLFLNDGVTQVVAGSFITFAQGNAGLRFTPGANLVGSGTFDIQASTTADDSGLAGSVVTATITVNPIADTPSVTNATTDEDVQTTGGLVISRNAVDGSEVTHFKITNIVNGTLFLNDGVTQVVAGSFITFAQGNAGLKFTPGAGLSSPSSTFSFDVQASIANNDADLGGASATATITVTDDAPPPPATDVQLIAIAADGGGNGSGPHVVVYDAVSRAQVGSFFAFSPNFRGGVRVAVGDVNGDGVDDIIVGQGAGGGQVRVIDGSMLDQVQSNGQISGSAIIAAFNPFGTSYKGGVFVAAGDFNLNEQADIVVGSGTNRKGMVRVFEGTSLGMLASFTTFGSGYRGGVTVAAGDINGDDIADVIAGRATGNSRIKLYSGAGFGSLGSIQAFGRSHTAGVFVSTGDVNGDGQADIIVGAGQGSKPLVRVFDGPTRARLASFQAFSSSFRGGVRVATANVDADPADEILLAPGPGSAPRFKLVNLDASVVDQVMSLDGMWEGGIFGG